MRLKMKTLRVDLTSRYGEEFSKKAVGEITAAIRRLEMFSDSGIDIARMYDIDTKYYYIFINHNYIVYRIESDKIVIANMFNEKEDFIMKLFGVSGRSQESIEYWGE